MKMGQCIDLLNVTAKDLDIEIEFFVDRSQPNVLVGRSWADGEVSIAKHEIEMNTTPAKFMRLFIHRIIRANIEMKNRINKQQKKLKEML